MKKVFLLIAIAAICITGTAQNKENKVNTEARVEPEQTMPEYPGGQEAMMKFISSQFKYPDAAVKNNVQGKVYVEFTVEEDGTTSSHKILRGISEDHGLNEEALRVARLLTGFKPARDNNGKAISQVITMPVSCVLPPARKG